MLHTPDTTKNKILVDMQGHQVDLVKSFDDETEEAELYIRAKDGNYNPSTVVMIPSSVAGQEYEPLVIKVKIPGAKLIEKKRK